MNKTEKGLTFSENHMRYRVLHFALYFEIWNSIYLIKEQDLGSMDQTVDILGLCDDTVGYSKTEEIENKPHTTLENNLVFEASKQEVGINGFNSKVSSEDKKHLIYNANIQRSYFVTMIPQTKMEFLRLFGMTVAGIVSIVLLYLIFDTKSKGIRNFKRILMIWSLRLILSI